MTFQEIILTLQRFWSEKGCVIGNPYDVETGAGTFNPDTFLMSLGPEPWNIAYVEPSRRPKDGRYGENPNRVYQHHQFQVIMKPSPENIQELYLESLEALGIDPKKHDIRFVEDNWESPTLGAWGLGWEVWLDGMEITQFTYFQQVGGIEVEITPSELTYGLEVNRKLEEARQTGLIGHSLDARVKLNITNDEYKFIFDKEANEIADIFIVSQVERVSEEANNSEIEGISIYIEKADGEKCERCWKYDVKVGQDPIHTDVCPRCAAVLKEIG